MYEPILGGFPGTDECGRRNVAMSNDGAGIGKGRYTKDWVSSKVAGKLHTDKLDGNYGGQTCTPIFTRNLQFTNTPLNGPSNPSPANVASIIY